MKKVIGISLFFCALSLITSCYYDVESELYPFSSSCDTTNVTYQLTVKPVLERNNCISCHNTSLSSGNVNLDNYDAILPYVNSGKLLSSVSHDGKASPMPQGMAKIQDCDIRKIAIWINKGAPNN